jgi:aminopeptidase N
VEIQVTLYRGLIDFSADVAELSGWLEGRGLPVGLALDSDMGWRIRYRLAVLGALADYDISAAFEADPGAQQFEAKCRAARPDAASKQSTWDRIMTDSELSSYRRWALAEGFWQPEQVELTDPYVERFFTEAPDATLRHGDMVVDWLVRFLYPRYSASHATLAYAEILLALFDVSLPLRRRVEDFTDDLSRVVAVRERASESDRSE